MSSINKIFVGGEVHTGKNILWRLLDGHSSMVSNCMHSNLGYFLLDERCKKYFLRKRPDFSMQTDSHIQMCKISYNTGEVATINKGSLLYALYTFSDYKTFYSWAKGSSMFVNMTERLNERFPFMFNIKGFEETLEKAMFSGEKVFTEEEVLDIIYSAYINNLNDTSSNNKLAQKKYFIDTLANGTLPLSTVAEKAPGAKIIIMVRDIESIVYANTIRICGYKGELDGDSSTFKKILYSQYEFENKLRLSFSAANKLEASNKNVILVNFSDLILNTEKTMKNLAKFIGIEYEPILASPSINGKVINSDKYKIIGEINDDPYKLLSEADMDLLWHGIHGFNKQYSILKNLLIFIRIIRWRILTIIVKKISKLLKFVLPRGLFIKFKKTINYW